MQKERLQKLADHLLKGKLYHDRFDFSVFERVPVEGALEIDCGTAGCALGEAPFLWPEFWTMVLQEEGSTMLYYMPMLKSQTRRTADAMSSACEFFEISQDAAQHLFIPGMQMTVSYGGEYLSTSATREQVADNIIIFIAKVEAEAIEYDATIRDILNR